MPLSVADHAALGKLLEEHQERLLACVRRRLDRSLQAAISPEDVFQEASQRAQQRYEAFKAAGRMTPYAWLYRLVLDVLIEAWRKHHRSTHDLRCDLPLPEASSLLLGEGNLVSPGTGPQTAAIREERRRHVRQVVELLSEKDRQVLWMRHQDGLTHAEVAAVLDLTETAATLRYARALKRFKDLWNRLHPHQGSSA